MTDSTLIIERDGQTFVVADELTESARVASQTARDKAQAWAEGELPGGPGTRSSKGHATTAGQYANAPFGASIPGEPEGNRSLVHRLVEADRLRERTGAERGFNLRSELLATVNMIGGDRSAIFTDSGTHTAVAGEVRLDGTSATVGEAIPNAGRYTYQASPAAWLRTGNTAAQDATIAGAEQVGLATGQADRAEEEADRATEQREAVDVAGGILAVRDATAILKIAAEAAQAAVEAALAVMADDRAATALDRAAAEFARQQAQAVVFNIIPIAQNALFNANGQITIGTLSQAGTGTDVSISIGREAGNGNNSRKFLGIGEIAGKDYSGYTPALIGFGAGNRTAVNHVATVGTHSFQNVNTIGRIVPGFGNFASGTLTFTGLPLDGKQVDLNGVVFTARTSPTGPYEFQIGANAPATVDALMAKITAANDQPLKDAMYRPGTGANANRIEIIAAGRGTWGNAYTLSTDIDTLALSAATLTGGTDHVNSLGAAAAGGAAMGFSAYLNADFGVARPAHGWMTFIDNPADGAPIFVGNSSRQFTFRDSPSAAQDIQRGASAAETAYNALKVLRASAAGDVSAADFYYWPYPNGPRIYAVHKTASGGEVYRLRSGTAAITSTPTLFGGQSSAPQPSSAMGHDAGRYALGGECFFALGAGYSFQGVGSFVGGRSAASNSILNNSFLWTPNSANSIRGGDIIAIGAGITSGAQRDWKQITGITPAGRITFAQRHGWMPGELITAGQRNNTTASNLIKLAGDNLATTPTALSLRVVNSTEVEFYDLRNPELPQPPYSITGDPTQIEIARVVSDFSTAMAFGRGSVLEDFTINIGSNAFSGGIKLRGGNVEVVNGGIAFSPTPAVPANPTANVGPSALGFVNITGAPTDGDTVTLNGVVFTFRTTPTGANNDVALGANAREAALNLIQIFNAVNPNVTSTRAHRAARASLERLSGTTWRVRLICQDFTGDTYTLAVSGSVLSVSGATLTGSGLGNLPAPLTVPNGLIVRCTNHPKQNGGIGLAMANHANNRWQFL